jgi:hypothetical protein
MSGAGAAVQRHMDEENGPLVTDLWRRTLRRRSQKDRVTWGQVTKLVDDWLPLRRRSPSTVLFTAPADAVSSVCSSQRPDLLVGAFLAVMMGAWPACHKVAQDLDRAMDWLLSI